MTKGKKYTFSTGVVILAIVVGLMSGLLLAGPLGSTGKGSSLYAGGGDSRLNAIMQIVSRYYVDQVDYDSLSTVAVRSMLSSLDPHSTYLSIEDYDKEAELLHGRFEGIGVVLFVLNDTVYASNVRKDGPAGGKPHSRTPFQQCYLDNRPCRMGDPPKGENTPRRHSACLHPRRGDD